MNKNIFRSRTVIGAVCILLAVLVCFGITPLFNEGLKAQTEAVRVKAEVIPRGTYITAAPSASVSSQVYSPSS